MSPINDISSRFAQWRGYRQTVHRVILNAFAGMDGNGAMLPLRLFRGEK
jgi:hypothetical protein